MSATISRRRIGVLVVLFALLLSAALIRAFQLTTIDSGRLSSAATTEHTATIVVPAARGEILDRNGAILAVDEAAEDISVTPQDVGNPITFATRLAPLLHVSATSIEEKLAHPTSERYTLLARQVPQAISARVKALKLPGVALASDPLRIYPFRYLASQVIGDVGQAGGGLGGIEYAYNRALAGTPGVQHVVYDASGTPISESGPSAKAGGTVELTIDAALQQDAEHVLSQTAATFQPLHETAIIMDPRTNAVLAMANWPRVNANDTAAMARAQNYATQLDYEPGSTFKVVAIGGALSDGLISPSTEFLIPDAYPVADRIIHDDDAHPTEWLSTSKILAYSSNIGAVKIGQLLEKEIPGTNQMYNWVRQYGFGSPTGIDLPEQQGIVPPPQTWSGSSIGNLPFGQGESVTPIQMATAYSAIANGGLLRPPHIVAGVNGAATHEPGAHRIFSPTIAKELRKMLEGVLLPGGTAHEIQIPGYELAGKTGTAQKVVDGTYSTSDYVASFVGFAPAEDPKIEALVVVDQPKNGYFGAEVAAPAWKQIMNFALNYLKIPSH